MQNSSIVDETMPKRNTNGTISFTAIVLINITIAPEPYMDRLLFEMRQKNTGVTFKAVLTDANKKWNISQMLVEMRRERFEYMRRNMK